MRFSLQCIDSSDSLYILRREAFRAFHSFTRAGSFQRAQAATNPIFYFRAYKSIFVILCGCIFTRSGKLLAFHGDQPLQPLTSVP